MTVDNPWWVGLAPLLAWCLDAVVRTRRWEPLVERAVQRATKRIEFAMRVGMKGNLVRGGEILVLWLMGGAFLIGWSLTQVGYILGEGAYGQFAVWTVGFFLLFGIRRRSAAGSDVMASLLHGNDEVARQWLEYIDGDPGDGTPPVVARATIARMSEGVVERAILATFWGITLGLGVAAAAVVVHELARFARSSADPNDPLWVGALRTERWVAWPASWIAVVVIYVIIPLAGGARARAMAGFLNHVGEPPLRRLSLAVEAGLGLQKTQTVEGKILDPCVPEDIQRSVIVLWTASAVGVAALSGVCTLVFHLI